MKEAVKLHMVLISSKNDRHPVPKTFTTLHSTPLHLSTLHFFPFKLYPSTLHYPSFLLIKVIALIPLHLKHTSVAR